MDALKVQPLLCEILVYREHLTWHMDLNLLVISINLVFANIDLSLAGQQSGFEIGYK